jgi:hypothetical protein
MHQQSKETIEGDIRALQGLKSHRGWAIIAETIQNEIVAAALQMADNPLMTEKEIDFRRGAIHASRSLLSVVDALITTKENDLLLLASAIPQAQSTSSATA